MILLSLLTTHALARSPELPPEARARRGIAPDAIPAPPPPASGFTFLGLLNSRVTATNVITTNPLINGQVVGLLGGLNTTSTAEEGSVSSEQRLGAFLRYAPPALDGRFALDTAFEIDYGFGDSSYGIGGNTGGAYGADQVNLQTRRLAGRVQLTKDATAVVGLQFVADGAHDPAMSTLDELTRAGGRLMYFGSEAAGLSVYGRVRDSSDEVRLRYRLGGYTLWEQAIGARDDVTLWMADAELAPAYATRVGVHAWYMDDRSGGAAGLLGSGPTSALSELQGGPRVEVRPSAPDALPLPETRVLWVGGDVGFNAGLDRGRVGGSAAFFGNLGQIAGEGGVPVGIQGGLFDAEVRGRWAPGAGSVVRAEAILATGDGPGRDYYTGVLTGNSWGIVGAVATTHGCSLLFPDARAINRQVAAVYDVSNGGAGLGALTASAGWDPIPNRLTLVAGGGLARAADGSSRGTELNARVLYRPWPLGELGLHGARLLGTAMPSDPWMVFTSLDGLVF